MFSCLVLFVLLFVGGCWVCWTGFDLLFVFDTRLLFKWVLLCYLVAWRVVCVRWLCLLPLGFCL